jgi:hypothetical protein
MREMTSPTANDLNEAERARSNSSDDDSVAWIADTSKLSVPVRVIAGVIGTGMIVAGAVAVFTTSNTAGAAALIIAGTVASVLTMFADRIRSIEAAGFKLQLEAAATAKLQAAQQAERAGYTELAEALRDEAQLLMSAVRPSADRYEDLRRQQGAGRERTAKMERVVQQLRETARAGSADRRSVERLFESGTDGNRIAALAHMQANPALAQTKIVTEVLRNPRSNFELYHALLITEELAAKDGSSSEAGELRAIVDQLDQSGRLGRPDSDRRTVASRILAMSEPSAS